MTLHVLGLPWTETTREWEAEAFTARTRVLATMMSMYGKVALYGGERNEAVVTEYVPIVDRAWQQRHFPGLTSATTFSDYDPSRPHWIEFNVRAADAIRKRAKRGDLLGITMGVSHQLTATLLADLELVPVEVGIGYKGVWAPFRVFESWAWRYFHSGYADGIATGQGQEGADLLSDVRNFDETIPRAYEVADFPEGQGDGGYFLYLGRVVARKGPHIAADVCRRIGAKLIVAGQGVASDELGRITATDGTILEGDVEYVGVVGVEERARLMGGAIATFCPTLYLEPGGGVGIESLLTGTPILSAEWGCFREYIVPGVNGYTCPTLADFMNGAKSAGSLNRYAIRQNAIGRYGTDAIGPQFDRYFRRLRTLRREGWYETPPMRLVA
jgi:glycosyltransferase involved in cell wall biosynthesis